MARDMTVRDSIVVDVDPETVYAQVSDPTQMGRWSPENRGAVVLGKPGPAYVGMEFVGSNRRGRGRWVTRCVVTAADPGRRFAFDVRTWGVRRPSVPVRIATWEYTFEAADGGTLVTETWTDGRRGWPDLVTGVFDRAATGGRTFADFQRRNIARTLRNLKADLER